MPETRSTDERVAEALGDRECEPCGRCLTPWKRDPSEWCQDCRTPSNLERQVARAMGWYEAEEPWGAGSDFEPGTPRVVMVELGEDVGAGVWDEADRYTVDPVALERVKREIERRGWAWEMESPNHSLRPDAYFACVDRQNDDPHETDYRSEGPTEGAALCATFLAAKEASDG